MGLPLGAAKYNSLLQGAASLDRLGTTAIGQAHEANLLIPRSVKTSQYRVRQCVHEGKPWATIRSRVNPITVQCKVGKCCSVSFKLFLCVKMTL